MWKQSHRHSRPTDWTLGVLAASDILRWWSLGVFPTTEDKLRKTTGDTLVCIFLIICLGNNLLNYKGKYRHYSVTLCYSEFRTTFWKASSKYSFTSIYCWQMCSLNMLIYYLPAQRQLQNVGMFRWVKITRHLQVIGLNQLQELSMIYIFPNNWQQTNDFFFVK